MYVENQGFHCLPAGINVNIIHENIDYFQLASSPTNDAIWHHPISPYDQSCRLPFQILLNCLIITRIV